MADLTKEQLRQQNETLFADNNSGNISAEDLRTFNNEVIDTLATENNPSFTGSVLVQGDVSASTYYGDGSNLTGVTGEVPSGTVSGSSQIDYPQISNIPSGIVSSSEQVSDITGSSLVTASFETQTLTFTKGDSSTFSVSIPDISGSDISSLNAFTASQEVINTELLNASSSFESKFDTIGTQSASWLEKTDITSLNTFTQSQEELNTTFATTGSNTFNGDETINGTNLAPGSTLNVKDGNGTPILQVNNATLKGLTDVDVLVNGNQFVNGNISATGSLGIADNSFIISSGSQNVEFSGQFSDGQAGVVFTAPNSKFSANGNLNLQALGGIFGVDAASVAFYSNTITSDGNHTVNGTNTAPQQTFIAKDGNGTSRLEVNNATLSGLTGADVLVNGDLLTNGSTTLFTDNAATTPLLIETLNGPKVKVSSKTEEDTSGVAFEVFGNGSVNGELFANSLQSEPSNADQPSLFVTDAVQPRVIVNSQNGAVADGWNIQLNGAIDVPSGNVSLSGTGQVLQNTNGAIVASTIEGQAEMATPLLLVDSLEPNTGGEITLPSGNFSLTGVGQVLQNPNGAIVASSIEGQAEMATPLFLVDSIEPNTGTDISVASGNLVFGGTGQVLNNQNGGIVGNSIGAVTDMDTPLLLVDSLEPNTGTSIDITGQQLSIASTATNETNAVSLSYINQTPGSDAATIQIGSDNLTPNDSKIQVQASQMQFGTGGSNDSVAFGNGSSTNTINFGVNGSGQALNINAGNNRAVFGGNIVATFSNVMQMVPQDPLPTGELGQLTVSGSSLYFHDNTQWREVSLV